MRRRPRPGRSVRLRLGTRADVSRLEALESRVFTHDRLSRRSFARFLNAVSASLIVADDGALCGYALVLFRSGSRIARVYSIAVDRDNAGRGLGSMLLRVAEQAACRRGARSMRLEVREDNAAAMRLYRKAGYGPIDRLPAYYDDGSNALRLQKRLGSGL